MKNQPKIIYTCLRAVNRQPWFPRGGLVETGKIRVCIAVSTWRGPCQPLHEKGSAELRGVHSPPVELQPPTTTLAKRRGQERGVPRSRGLLSAQSSARSSGQNQPTEGGFDDFDAPEIHVSLIKILNFTVFFSKFPNFEQLPELH